MSHQPRQAIGTAADLRQSFDSAFAGAIASERPQQDDVLVVGIASDSYAIRLADIAGLRSDARITSLPGSLAELVGIASVRGTIVPVYDFRTLFGYPRAPVHRWFVIAAAAPVAFAFDRYEGHQRVGREAIAAASRQDAGAQSPFVREVVRTDAVMRPIIHLASVLEHVAALVHQRPGRKGRS